MPSRRFPPTLSALLLLSLAGPLAADDPASAPGSPRDGEQAADRFARLALECVGREYPNKIAHTLDSDADAKPPRELTPAFFGCYDWHSAVHGHWLLARVARRFPASPVAPQARAALDASLTPEKLAAEAAYLEKKGREGFERPYGLAWLLQLAAELREWDDPDARRWSAALAPLERAAAGRLAAWIPKLAYPVRQGEHFQTAFSFGLALDWARVAGDRELEALLVRRSRDLYGNEPRGGCPLAWEPSGQDFLSPCLAEADLMRRVLPQREFSRWLAGFLPAIAGDGSAGWLAVGRVTDRSDGKLAHIDGLNLSRAFMLGGIASALPPADPRRASLLSAAAKHRVAGLEGVAAGDYMGGHWLGTFAVYLETGRGLPATR